MRGTVTYSLYSGSTAAACVVANQVTTATVAVTAGSVANGTFSSVAGRQLRVTGRLFR